MITILSLLPVVFSATEVRPKQLSTTPDTTKDGVRHRALRLFHGPDLRGKDGPLGKAGLDLATVYVQYRQGQRGDQNGVVRVREGRVAVDIIGQAGQTDTLQQQLADLGLSNLTRNGRLLSGWLPIKQLPEVARLSALQSIQPSVAQTIPSERGGTSAGNGSNSESATSMRGFLIAAAATSLILGGGYLLWHRY